MIVAVAMTFVITTGGIDLSVGSVLALVNALAAISMQAGVPWPAVVVLMLLVGIALGLLKGFFIACEGIPAFIVTLAGLSAIRGFALSADQRLFDPDRPGEPVQRHRPRLGFRHPVARNDRRRRFHRRIHCLQRDDFRPLCHGHRRERRGRPAIRREYPARRAGVYVLSGLSAALAGLIIAARLGSGSSNAGEGFELDVIAAVVLGGTSLFGGRGTHGGHGAWRADGGGDRQRPDPVPSVAFPYADRRRASSSWSRSG